MKYLVKNGYIQSAFDKDRHFITNSQLIKLFNVAPKDCIYDLRGYRGEYKVLSPDYYGRYDITRLTVYEAK